MVLFQELCRLLSFPYSLKFCHRMNKTPMLGLLLTEGKNELALFLLKNKFPDCQV